jgi:hypothetical protein
VDTLQKQILYDVEWQILRTQLLSKNNYTGGWASTSGASINLERLNNYLGGNPNLVKVWRVLNLLDAVRMGYSGQQRIGSPQDKLVKRQRDKLSKIYKKMSSIYTFEIPSEEETISDIREASGSDLRDVYKDLYNRWDKHRNSLYRSELKHFLDLIEKYRPEIINC